MRKIVVDTFRRGDILLWGETYPIKEKLKELGYSWNPVSRNWVKESEDLDKEVEKLKKIEDVEVELSEAATLAPKLCKMTKSDFSILNRKDGKVGEIVIYPEDNNEESVKEAVEDAKRIYRECKVHVSVEAYSKEKGTYRPYDSVFDEEMGEEMEVKPIKAVSYTHLTLPTKA